MRIKHYVHNLVEVNHGHNGTGNKSQRGCHASSTALRDTGDAGLAAGTASLGGSGVSSSGSGGILGRSMSGNDGLSNSGGLLSGLSDTGEGGRLLGGNGSSCLSGSGGGLGDRGSGI